jgi:hypothetical protein
MIIDLSKNLKEDRQKIQELVGKPFSFLKRIEQGGIGSARMQLRSYSQAFAQYFAHTHSNVFANIELRPKGIIVHFKKYQTHLGWIIPYYKLALYQSTQLSVHSDGQFLKFDPAFLKHDHARFFYKMKEAKNTFLGDDYLFI